LRFWDDLKYSKARATLHEIGTLSDAQREHDDLVGLLFHFKEGK